MRLGCVIKPEVLENFLNDIRLIDASNDLNPSTALLALLDRPRSDRWQRRASSVVRGKEYPYGQFVATASTLAMPEEAPLKAVADFRYTGTTFPRLDALAKSTGTAEYGVDIDIPGLHHAVVRRSPVAGARLASCDKSAAEMMPGVVGIFEISIGVAVVAEKYWQAKMAAALLPQWQEVALMQRIFGFTATI